LAACAGAVRHRCPFCSGQSRGRRHERTFLGTPVRDRRQIDERPGQRRPSVDVELVALRVFHRDCVVVEAFCVQDTDEQGTEIGQTAPARRDRRCNPRRPARWSRARGLRAGAERSRPAGASLYQPRGGLLELGFTSAAWRALIACAGEQGLPRGGQTGRAGGAGPAGRGRPRPGLAGPETTRLSGSPAPSEPSDQPERGARSV